MKLDRLILKKIIKIVATRCQILRLKCTKFDFGCTALPQTSWLDFRGLLLRGGRERGVEGKGKEGRGGIRGAYF